MKSLLIDTNIYTYALKGDPEVVSVLQQAHEIGISAVSIGELLSGFKAGKKEQENRHELEEFLDSPRVRVYGIDEETAEFYAEVLNNLKKKGRPIPTNDIWIASLAFQHGQPLFSKDKHFEAVPGLVMVSY
ncbi:MAG: PilT protein domain protein [Deltaproteobacteria bacterium]|nr:PilT protein domain protein [Deltaproteobacteria bacterium]NTV32875.1 type II toxin-antitoxin system VapC family toxin [Deltaproteobacteria bacterium]NTV57368.1 type II toxin-antitoxin system VapC family toxin [Deltaproteobacteria bacterium]